KPNFGIEPLPDIDFNIRCGNTLVGYATADEVRRAFKEDSGGQGKLMLGESSSAYARFEDGVQQAAMAFRTFHEMQNELGMKADEFTATREDWPALATALRALAAEGEAVKSLASPHGTKYVVDGNLHTPGGPSTARTVWIFDRGSEAPRLVT